MKKNVVKIYIACLSVLLLNMNMQAEGRCINKTKSNGDFRLKAHARASNLGAPTTDTHISSNPSDDITASASKGCATQSARNNAGSHSFDGKVTQRQCSRGYGLSDLTSALLPMMKFKPSEEEILEECVMGSSGVSISGQTVTILGINGFMRAVEDMVSIYSVKIWIPSDDKDTTIDVGELLFNGAIKIINGAVSLEGDFIGKFGSSHYKDSLQGLFRKVRFLGSDLSIALTLPSGKNMEDVAIVTETDGFHNEEYSKAIALGLTSSNINSGLLQFNAFPNPSKNEWKCAFSSRNPNSSTLNIKLFGLDGAVLYETKLQSTSEKEIEFKVAVPQEGKVFFLLVDDGAEKHLKQLLKE
jgi:hypothetical protein